MNKIGRWHKASKVLPVTSRPVLLDLGDSVYVVSRLYSINEDGKTLFVTDGTCDPQPTNYEDVKRWAYIKLEKY